jgi:hypothetical protein
MAATSLAPDTSAPVIEHAPLVRHDGAGPVVVTARIVDASVIFQPTLLVRRVGGGAFVRVPLVKVDGDIFAADVPPALLAGDVEYFLEAFDEEGNGPAQVGDEAVPLTLKRDLPAPPPPPPPPVVQEDSGGGFVLGGVVVGTLAVIGAAVGIALTVYALRPPAPEVVRIAVTGPTPIEGAP